MTPDMVGELLREALLLITMIVAVIIGPSLVVGLIVSTFQAATQINEQTLSFLPRLLITLLTLVVMADWIVTRLINYTQKMIAAMTQVLT